jgi:hypothetical protein
LHGNKQLDTCVENIFQMCENKCKIVNEWKLVFLLKTIK